MAAAPPPGLLCHWDGSSRSGLLISALPSPPHDTIHSLPSSLLSVTAHVHLCLGKLRLQIKTFQAVRLRVHAVAIPGRRTDFLFAQSTLPYLH